MLPGSAAWSPWACSTTSRVFELRAGDSQYTYLWYDEIKQLSKIVALPATAA
jgi:hypothetical protein